MQHLNSQNKSHNYGIDILRVLATLFVIMIHLIPGIKVEEMSGTFIYQFILKPLLCTCINLFGLISGYLCWNRKLNIRRIIRLYGVVLFYSIAVTILAFFFVDIAKSDFAYCFIPLLSARYWYFSAYIAMCFLIPIMNLAITHLENKKEAVEILLGLLFAFTILTFLKDGNNQGIGIHYGFSTMWLCVCYLCGGLISKFNLTYLFNTRRWVTIGAACWIITSAYLIIISNLANGQKREWLSVFLYRYSSPTIIIMAICLLAVCSNVKISNLSTQKCLIFLSSTSFGTYILGSHWVVIRHIIEGQLTNMLTGLNSLEFIVKSTLYSVALYGLITFIEFIRQHICRLTHLNEISNVIVKVVNRNRGG